MNDTERLNVLTDVRGDISRLEAELANLRQLETYLASKSPSPHSPTVPSQFGPAQFAPMPVPPRVPLANGRRGTMTMADAAEVVLRESGGPMKTNELVREIFRRGLYPWDGEFKQLVNSVFSAMRRDENRFQKPGPGMWTLVGEGQADDG